MSIEAPYACLKKAIWDWEVADLIMIMMIIDNDDDWEVLNDNGNQQLTNVNLHSADGDEPT